MGLNILTLGSSKTYTRESLLGGGAVVGKNVTVSSITPIDGGNRVTFSYTLDNGTVKTSTMDVMDGKDGIDGTNGKNGKDGQPGKDGSDGIGISKIEKIGTVDLVDTYRITFTDNSTFDYEVTNGKDGQGGGTVDVPIEKIKVNGELQTPVNKVVDITVPSIEGLTKDADLAAVAKSGDYEDLINKPTIPDITGLATETYVDNKVADYTKTVDLADVATSGSYNDLVDKPTIPSLDGYAKTSEIPSKVSELENDSNYLSSIPEEYVTETELSAKGYLTEHQDISGKVDKVEGKSLISDTEIARLASVDNYDDTDIRTELANKADTTAIPSKVSELTNDSNYQTAEQVSSTVTTEIAKVVADAPESLNTLKEMSDWIAGHEDDASAMNSAISDNKTAITALQTGKADKSDIPTTVAELTDSADYAKTADVNDSISTLQTGKADASDLTAHTGDSEIHVTAEDKTLWNTVSDKIDKIEGKGLSSNDYTDEEKTLVATIGDKVDKSSIATALDDTVTDEQVTSALLAKTELEKKVDKTSIATTLSSESTNDEVVGAKLAYDELEKAELATKEQFATASGETISVNDSVDGKILDLKLYGKSFQQTYRGVNLFNPDWIPTKTDNGVTCTNNGNNSWTFSGSITDTTKVLKLPTFFTKDTSPKQFHKAGYYTVSVSGVDLGRTNQYLYINIHYNGETHYDFLNSRSKPTGQITEEILSYDDFYVEAVGFWMLSGDTLKTGTVSVQIEYSETPTEFESYVGCLPAPNQLYPQEIKSVVNPTVKVCGKNLIKPTCVSNTRNGLTMTCNSDGSCTFNGTSTSTSNLVSYNFGIPNIVPGKKYKIVGCPSGGGWDKYAIGIDGHSIDAIGSSADLGSGSIFTPTKNDNAILCIWIKPGYPCNNLTFKPMIVDAELYPDATYNDYEPYKETTATFPYTLNAIPVESGGNVTIDGQEYISDYVDFEKKQLVRVTKEINLDDATWILVNTDKYQYWRCLVNDGKEASSYNSIANILAEKYIGSSWSNTVPLNSAANVIAYGFNTASEINKNLAVSNGSTTETPTGKFLYELASPNIINLTDDEVLAFKELQTYSSTTNIFVTSEQLNGYAECKYPTTDVSGIISEHDVEIEKLKNADTEIKLDIQNNVKNQFATASGDFITVNDSVDGNIVELGVKGNSFQQTYSGKNLLIYPYTDTTNTNSGITFTDNGDGSVSINGQNTTDQWLYFWLFSSKADDEYRRENLYGKQLIISGLKNDVGSVKLESYYKTTDDKEYWIRPTNNDDYFTITYPSKSEIALMNLAIVVYPNGVVNNVTVKPMIRLATETDPSYEIYVGGIPSPNPSYPQTINSVGDDGSLVVKSCGKNLLKNINGDSFLHTGITYTKNSDGSISCTGTQTGHSYYPLNDDLKVDFKGKYILSGNTTTNSNEWGYCLFLQLELEDGSFRYIFNNNPDEVVADFSQYPTLKYVRPYIRIGKDAPALTDKTITFYPMLRPYGTDGTYEPYKESTTTIPLSEPLRAIGDIKDEITYQDGKWGVLRRIKKLIADNPVRINPSGSTIGTAYDILVDFDAITPDAYIVVNATSDKSKHVFYNYQSEYVWGEDKCGAYITWTGGTFARLNSSICGSTLDEVKEYFKNNPLIGFYVLATPVFEPFADQTLPYLSTYDGTTNISNDDELSAEMTVKYPTTDSSGVGSRNESRIAELSKDTDDKFDDVNESLSVIGKCKNLLNPKLETTTKNGVTCTNNGDGTYNIVGTNNTSSNATFIFDTVINGTGQRKLLGVPKDSSGIILQTNYDGSWGQSLYWDTGNGAVLPNIEKLQSLAILVYAGATVNHTIKPMITTDLNATYDDFVPYTGDGDTLTEDVAEIKNDLSVKKFELVAGTLWLCVSGKHCVLTLNGYNLTESTHFDKLEEYQPYLVARNVVSKGDSVCIAAVEPNGNINASDLVVGTQLTGQLFGEISWIANI